MACDNSSTDPECGPGNGPHCYDHDPACCHCGKPRPECEHPNKQHTGSVYDGPGGRKTWLYYTCQDCKAHLKEEELDEPKKPEPSTECEGCGHPEHSGVCRELEMPGPPGDVDECGCLDDREPPLTPEEEEMVSDRCTCGETACESELCDCDSAPCPVDHAREASEEASEDACTCGAAGDAFVPLGHYKDCPCAPEAPEDALPPPEGPEYTPCVCGHFEPEHEVDGYCYDEKCGCVGYRTKPDFETPPQPDRRPPYLLAYSVQGHLYEMALPGDATVAALDGRLVITHSLGPVAGICQIAPITSEEN